MKTNKMLLFVLITCLTVTAFSQKYLEKPYEKWSKDEAMKILTDSPWAETYQSIAGNAAITQQGARRDQADNRLVGSERGSSARTLTVAPVVFRLHSALPIRQAIVRMQQIQSNYDKMSAEQRSKFDESTKSILDCAICKNYYVVTLTKFRDSSGLGVDEGILQTMKFEDMKGNVWLLNDKDEKRELIQFTPPKGSGDSAVFFFKRTDDKGNAFLTPESKKLKFVFANEFIDKRNTAGAMLPRMMEFNVAKLLLEDKVEF